MLKNSRASLRTALLAVTLLLVPVVSGAQASQALRIQLSIDSEEVPAGVDPGLTPTSRVMESTGGLIFVLQNRDQRVRVFDARGAFVRDIGRSGAGPGETRSMGGMGLIGDTLWTINAFPSKVNFFDGEGRVLASRVIPEIKRGTEVWMANAVLSDSRALFWPRPIGPRDPTRRQDLFLAGWDTTQSVRVATVPLFPWGSIRMPTPGENEVLVSRTALFRMGRTGPLTRATGGAFVVADQPACERNATLPITVHDPEGAVRARTTWL